MNEFDIVLTGAVGGFVASIAMMFVTLGHIKYCYDRKFEAIQLQLISLRSELNSGYSE